MVSVATAADGSTTALTWIGGAPWEPSRPDALGLVRLDRSGAVLCANELANPHGAELDALSMAVSPAGAFSSLFT